MDDEPRDSLHSDSPISTGELGSQSHNAPSGAWQFEVDSNYTLAGLVPSLNDSDDDVKPQGLQCGDSEQGVGSSVHPYPQSAEPQGRNSDSTQIHRGAAGEQASSFRGRSSEVVLTDLEPAHGSEEQRGQNVGHQSLVSVKQEPRTENLVNASMIRPADTGSFAQKHEAGQHHQYFESAGGQDGAGTSLDRRQDTHIVGAIKEEPTLEQPQAPQSQSESTSGHFQEGDADRHELNIQEPDQEDSMNLYSQPIVKKQSLEGQMKGGREPENILDHTHVSRLQHDGGVQQSSVVVIQAAQDVSRSAPTREHQVGEEQPPSPLLRNVTSFSQTDASLARKFLANEEVDQVYPRLPVMGGQANGHPHMLSPISMPLPWTAGIMQNQHQGFVPTRNSMHSLPQNYFFQQMQMPSSYQQEYFSQQGSMSGQQPGNYPGNGQTYGKAKSKAYVKEIPEVSDGESSSDDDQPLMTRTQRRPPSSNTTDSVIDRPSFPSCGGGQGAEPSRQMQHISSKSKQTPHNIINPSRHPTNFEASKSPSVPRATTYIAPQQNSVSQASSSGAPISWKLPTYAVEPQPSDPVNDTPCVKVSLPGMPRELLFLSHDYATQEVNLLEQIFLPNQQALATPDQTPNIALLNFHNICIMVLDAYTAFEVGDLEPGFGSTLPYVSTGRWPIDQELERRHDAKDADVDEIFFAVVDCWRVGIARERKSYTLIRGVQEFCDIALDIIYYIKENGLLREKTGKQRKERKDKGVKRGSRVDKAEAAKSAPASMASSSSGNKGKDKEVMEPRKRGRPSKASLDNKGSKRASIVNEVKSRKKAKTDQTGSISVTRRK